MKTVIAIIVLLLVSITATVFSVREANVELPLGETQSAVTQTVTEKETATEFLSVTESETEAYEIETETVVQTTESKAETTTQKPATTKPITTTTQRATIPSTTQAPVTTTKPVTTMEQTTSQPTTNAQTVDIDYYINYAKNYGKSIGLEYDSSATACWDTPIGVATTNHDAVIRDKRIDLMIIDIMTEMDTSAYELYDTTTDDTTSISGIQISKWIYNKQTFFVKDTITSLILNLIL